MDVLEFNPVWAGAIFTQEQLQFVFAVFVVGLIVFVVLVGFFVRSCFRLITQEEKSPNDVMAVGLGLLLLLPTVAGWAWTPVENWSRSNDEATAMQLIEEVTGRSESEFDQGRWIDPHNCTFYKVNLLPEVFEVEELDPAVPAVSEMIRRDAELFENAGWVVTKFAPEDPEFRASVGVAFRAEQGDHALQLYNWDDLGYAYLDSDCPVSTGSLPTWRVIVEEFPDATG